mmetsp:Transcript_23147/g.24665  ORF Transcript_23147/g.24665 Transcript_23147/m.24665 type:complete len:96 (+) Transcript_23147:490-777(+)
MYCIACTLKKNINNNNNNSTHEGNKKKMETNKRNTNYLSKHTYTNKQTKKQQPIDISNKKRGNDGTLLLWRENVHIFYSVPSHIRTIQYRYDVRY